MRRTRPEEAVAVTSQVVAETLVIAFIVIVRNEFGYRPTKVTFTEWNHAVQALLFDRADKPLRIGTSAHGMVSERLARQPS